MLSLLKNAANNSSLSGGGLRHTKMEKYRIIVVSVRAKKMLLHILSLIINQEIFTNQYVKCKDCFAMYQNIGEDRIQISNQSIINETVECGQNFQEQALVAIGKQLEFVRLSYYNCYLIT